jgi:hypothetical protein
LSYLLANDRQDWAPTACRISGSPRACSIPLRDTSDRNTACADCPRDHDPRYHRADSDEIAHELRARYLVLFSYCLIFRRKICDWFSFCVFTLRWSRVPASGRARTFFPASTQEPRQDKLHFSEQLLGFHWLSFGMSITFGLPHKTCFQMTR